MQCSKLNIIIKCKAKPSIYNNLEFYYFCMRNNNSLTGSVMEYLDLIFFPSIHGELRT